MNKTMVARVPRSLVCFMALALMAALMIVLSVVKASPAAAVTCYDRLLPRVEFSYNKPLSSKDTYLEFDTFYRKCEGPQKWWVKPTMHVMSWDVIGGTCTHEFDYIVWEFYAYDPFGHSMNRTFKQYCDNTSEDSRSVVYNLNNVPALYFAKSGTWPDLAPKWRVKAEIVRHGPVINSSFVKKGAFPLY